MDKYLVTVTKSPIKGIKATSDVPPEEETSQSEPLSTSNTHNMVKNIQSYTHNDNNDIIKDHDGDNNPNRDHNDRNYDGGGKMMEMDDKMSPPLQSSAPPPPPPPSHSKNEEIQFVMPTFDDDAKGKKVKRGRGGLCVSETAA